MNKLTRSDTMISGIKYWSDGTAVAGQQFEYKFDDIGNRQQTASGGDQWGTNLRYASYTPNLLNQYTSRTVPGAVDVIGSAHADATVTHENSPAYRRGEYFRKEISLDNSEDAVYETIDILGVLKDGEDPDIKTVKSGEYFLPETPEAFTYDEDGNLTADGRWTYTWDGENRLIQMEALSGIPTDAKKKLQFEYDHQGRRIRKKVFDSDGTTLLTDVKFLYDGWNLSAELDAMDSDSLVRSYGWGLDLSGSLQGAGGVGGLLFATDHTETETHFAAYDGNGNVMILVLASDGSISGRFEYGPFGETIVVEGSAASVPFRFSTKYTDAETGLLYYGYRYFDPSAGRWLNRDPIGERGGLNVYGFVGNDAIQRVDPTGLFWFLTGCSTPCKDPCGDAKKADLHKIKGVASDGGVICCGGKKYACDWSAGGKSKAASIIGQCIEEHEKCHLPHVDCNDPSCKGKTLCRPPFKDPSKKSQSECECSDVEIACLKKADCSGDPACETRIEARINQMEDYKNKHGCK